MVQLLVNIVLSQCMSVVTMDYLYPFTSLLISYLM